MSTSAATCTTVGRDISTRGGSPSFPSESKLEHLLTESFGNWPLRQDILYLDNGAFGACPTIVSEVQKDIRHFMEANPQGFFERAYAAALKASKEALANFINANVSGLVLVPGATYGLNAVIQCQSFNPEDEILTTNHAYSSVKLALEHIARRDGARVVIVDIPFPIVSKEVVLRSFLAQVTSQTRFAVIDYVTSRSGLIFPVKEIVATLASRNIDTLVDGAHAPGMIELDLKDTNAAYFAANCHKWMCTPQGVGFLHVREDRLQKIKPLVFARSPHRAEPSKHSALEHCFDWLGTYDPSAFLSLPASIDFLETVIPGGYSALVRRNHKLAVLARKVICRALGIKTPSPDDMIGAMSTIPLPDSVWPESEGMLPLQEALWQKYGIVVPVYSWPSYPKRVIRLSVQAYNFFEQYVRLADCLKSALEDERNSNMRIFDVRNSMTYHWSFKKRSDSSSDSSSDYSFGIGCAANRHSDSLNIPYEDIRFPTPWQLYCLARSRIRKIAGHCYPAYPLSVYPTADEAETQFVLAGRKAFRHANMEISRITYMLSRIATRRLPKLVAPLIERLLKTEDIFESWVTHVETLRNHTQTLTRAIIFEMNASRAPVEFPMDGGAFVSRIVPYVTETMEDNLSLRLWLSTITEFAKRIQIESSKIVESFLQIHAFLKDPIGGLRKDLSTQAQLFVSLLHDVKLDLGETTLPLETWEGIAAQLALESSFLAIPDVQRGAYVHFSADQQLVYAYVQMDSLGRSEFATPQIVVQLLKDMFHSSNNKCDIAPITVAYGYPMQSGYEPKSIVVDGNNRVTAIATLRFLAIYGLPEDGNVDSLREYCRDHGLGPLWFVDICAVLQALWDTDVEVARSYKDKDKLSRFRDIRQIPALITEEPCFLTKATTDEGDIFLQPVHQSIFATDDMLVALEAKKQLHGRSKGFKALPIR
jgi:selenocysteine lyase/cysteine desulfurase